jgi:hypothetical protein
MRQAIADESEAPTSVIYSMKSQWQWRQARIIKFIRDFGSTAI